ncbi:ER membrane protein complex subunit 8 [Lepeophtheirus salmonis]|uniref:Neighbor of COX4 n=2 Tax=Lepeophtheirus salmonis TaxID=72036 RepID=D3PHS4_LEPSM|nr:ER membrane protein complex subunit 8-like [Lepeophtheirus salmonis]ADD38110.1 Neighbor of COX4 [Lepeophtheirus salmonis]
MDSLPRLEFSSRAFAKIICHAAKYPSCAINGLLLSSRVGSDPLVVVDAVPLFHDAIGLTPMLEVALAQIESRFGSDKDCIILGVYHANELFSNVQVDVFNQRIADKVSEHCPHPGLLVTVDNTRLSCDMKRGKEALIVRQAESNGKWKLRDDDDNDILLEEGGAECAAHLMSKKAHKNLIDFDNHLDDITKDYVNTSFNDQVEDFMSQIFKDD